MNIKICDANKDEIDLIKNSTIEDNLEDILGYYGQPEDKINDLKSYKDYLEVEAKYWIDLSSNRNMGGDVKRKKHNEELVHVKTITNNKIDFIIGHMTNYINPYKSVHYVKVTREDSTVPLTNVELLALYTKAWQWMINEEKESYKTTKQAKYGFVRDLTMLTYNGSSEVKVYNNFVVAYFSVDS